jgi:hypothetical protein
VVFLCTKMDESLNNPWKLDEVQQVYNPLNPQDGVVELADPLALGVEDKELIDTIDDRIEASNKFFENKYNLKARRRKNEMMLFGRQIDNAESKNELKVYDARYLDNALYEIESSLKPLAMSHLPDMIVLPGSDNEDSIKSAKDISLVVDTTNKKRRQRQVLAIGFKHLPVYFTAVLKARWDPEMGEYGDYRFDPVHPEYIVFDHTATSTNPDDMSFIAQCLPLTVQDVIMRFPKARTKFLEELEAHGVKLEDGKPNSKQLASEIKIWEVHFTWYKRKGSDQLMSQQEMLNAEPGVKWERVEGICWKFEKCLLQKMKTPNWDYEGEQKWFTYDDPSLESSKREVKVEELLQQMMSGQPLDGYFQESVYHNYFDMPKKPYFFFGYDQWGKVAIDETTRIEQNIRNQENLDEQGKQITNTLKSRIKHIWSKDSGMRSEDVQKMDMENPKLDALVEGDPNKVHAEVRPERPDAAQFKNLADTRDRMYAISGSNAIRGDLQSDVATTNQIAREADFTRADDLVTDTIEAASEWMAEWQLQFIKLRYTDEHMRQLLGDKGAFTFVKLRRDMISDGMEVIIKSSSTDKLRAQKNAMEMAKLGPPFIDPLTFFEDMEMSDPKGRAEKGIMFINDPAGYFAKYIMELPNSKAMIGALNGQAGAAIQPGGGQPPVPSAPPGPMTPQNPTSTDTTATPFSPPAGPPMASPRAM